MVRPAAEMRRQRAGLPRFSRRGAVLEEEIQPLQRETGETEEAMDRAKTMRTGRSAPTRPTIAIYATAPRRNAPSPATRLTKPRALRGATAGVMHANEAAILERAQHRRSAALQ